MKRIASDARAFRALALFLALLALPCLWPGPAAERAMPADAPADVIQEQPKLIALTFDDGPRRSTTTQLLDGLAQRGAKATFFLIGAQIENNEDIIQRMEAEGHQVGIHTFDHVRLIGLNWADFNAQVEKTRAILERVLGHETFALRPPYGLYDEGVRDKAGAPIILWSIDPEDWGDRNTEREVAHILKNARDGAIVLLHDIYPESVQTALRVVDELHRQGYLFVTVEELFAARSIQLKAGEVYLHAYP